ncbi:MAG: MBL fold metallo-hydrolase, partial [Candidatus Lokiarchaeota archaeon]|nr:MBL fold metallo-hydrolase [Candidatus Lokiarchaeota archaeon]
MDVIFLGTSGAIPTKNRNLPGIALLYKGKQILMDTGEDIQRQFEYSPLKFNSPLQILISHLHGDHIIGLPGLLFHFQLIHRDSEVEIYGPPGIFEYLMTHKKYVGLHARYLHNIYEFQENGYDLLKYNFQDSPDQMPKQISLKKEYQIIETESYCVKAVPVCHSIPTWGFKFIEKDRTGKFNPKRAKELKIPMGPLWRKMQKNPNKEILI